MNYYMLYAYLKPFSINNTFKSFQNKMSQQNNQEIICEVFDIYQEEEEIIRMNREIEEIEEMEEILQTSMKMFSRETEGMLEVLQMLKKSEKFCQQLRQADNKWRKEQFDQKRIRQMIVDGVFDEIDRVKYAFKPRFNP